MSHTPHPLLSVPPPCLLGVQRSTVNNHYHHRNCPTGPIRDPGTHHTHTPTTVTTIVVRPLRVGVRDPSLHVYGRHHLPTPLEVRRPTHLTCDHRPKDPDNNLSPPHVYMDPVDYLILLGVWGSSIRTRHPRSRSTPSGEEFRNVTTCTRVRYHPPRPVRGPETFRMFTVTTTVHHTPTIIRWTTTYTHVVPTDYPVLLRTPEFVVRT